MIMRGFEAVKMIAEINRYFFSLIIITQFVLNFLQMIVCNNSFRLEAVVFNFEVISIFVLKLYGFIKPRK